VYYIILYLRIIFQWGQRTFDQRQHLSEQQFTHRTHRNVSTWKTAFKNKIEKYHLLAGSGPECPDKRLFYYVPRSYRPMFSSTPSFTPLHSLYIYYVESLKLSLRVIVKLLLLLFSFYKLQFNNSNKSVRNDKLGKNSLHAYYLYI